MIKKDKNGSYPDRVERQAIQSRLVFSAVYVFLAPSALLLQCLSSCTSTLASASSLRVGVPMHRSLYCSWCHLSSPPSCPPPVISSDFFLCAAMMY